MMNCFRVIARVIGEYMFMFAVVMMLSALIVWTFGGFSDRF